MLKGNVRRLGAEPGFNVAQEAATVNWLKVYRVVRRNHFKPRPLPLYPMDSHVEAFKPRFAPGSGMDSSLKRFLTNFDRFIPRARALPLELNSFRLALNSLTD